MEKEIIYVCYEWQKKKLRKFIGLKYGKYENLPESIKNKFDNIDYLTNSFNRK